MIHNTSSNPVTPVGDKFEFNGVVPSVVVTGGTFTYDGSAHVATGSITGIPGLTATFTYTDASGHSVATPINAGTYTVSASYVDSANYISASATGTITITRAIPTITWPTPAVITYGTALGSAQLNATATAVVNGSTVSVPGSFVYSPACRCTKILPPG